MEIHFFFSVLPLTPPPPFAPQLRAVVALTTDLAHRSVVVRTVRVCGTVASAKRAARAAAAAAGAETPPLGKAAARLQAEAGARLDALSV